MVRRGLLAQLTLSILLLGAGAGAAPQAQMAGDTAAFIGAALRGIGAQATACPAPVVEQTRARDMAVMCARFDGDFENFRTKWAEWTAAAEPKTGWSVSGLGLNYDRIYAIGAQAVGVRFARGEILIVYK